MTIAELSSHFRHRELRHDDNWRSFSTRRNYEYVLDRWIVRRWGKYELGDVRTIEIESRLRSLPLARSSCAKSGICCPCFSTTPGGMSCLIGIRSNSCVKSAKRRTAPNVIIPAEIKGLLDHLEIRERTLVLLRYRLDCVRVNCLPSNGETSFFPRAP